MIPPSDDINTVWQSKLTPAEPALVQSGQRRWDVTQFLRDFGVTGVFGMNMQRSPLMKTRIHPTAARLAGTFLLILSMVTGSAQRNEVLPSPKAVDPATGQMIPGEPVQLHPDIENQRLSVDFNRPLELPEIVSWLRQAVSHVDFVVSSKLLDEVGGFGWTIKLRSANVRDILTALGIASDGQVWFEVLTPTLIALVPNPATAPAEIPEPPAHQVVNLREILEVREPAFLEEAISTINHLVRETLATIHGNPALAPKLNYHPGSGVLVIVGQRDAIQISMDIIRNLQPHYRQPRETRPEPGSDRE
jgi:hypothetical protein